MYRSAGIASVVLAATVVVAGSASAGQMPNIAGSLQRGQGDALGLSLNNSGDTTFDAFRFELGRTGFQIMNLQMGQAPPGTQCQASGGQGFCNFQNGWQPGQALMLGFHTGSMYPDNGGAQGFACPRPCTPTSMDAGPFNFPGPVPQSGGQTIPPGFDLFETDPAATVFSFRDQFAIPADFFGPGSQPFTGDVNFGGRPLDMFMQNHVGDADTIVRRGAAAMVPPQGPSQPIPIELVGLQLISIEPITVSMQSGSDSFFDVFVDLSLQRPSQGQMVIGAQGADGGQFQSQLQVFPRFTFVPVDGGQSRVLDVGAFPPDAARDEELRLRQAGGVWRRGCIPPALLVRGLNDDFCPGLTPGGQKMLTVEQAALARHGVYPAQPQLEHFQCYSLRDREFRRRRVTLADQFGNARVRVTGYAELCNPVRKKREPFRNRQAHLQCYAIRRSQRARVAIRNQFGSQRLQTTRARRLCVPSLKFTRSAPTGVTLTDHFQCYDVRRTRFRGPRVRLTDQFGRKRVRVGRPVRLCNPVQKNDERIQHPVQHLVCYALPKRRFRPRRVFVRNQFGNRQAVVAERPRVLCVPSLKLRL